MIEKNKIYLTVFFSGFVLMVFEIVGIRILAPYLGSSSVVWTSIIGVILTFMSLGYWYGGVISDRNPTLKKLSYILVFTAISFLILNLSKEYILYVIARISNNLILKSLVGSVILFSIPSFLLALISPIAIRINIKNIENSGETVGAIYAISTIGSILGTFLSGFFFIAFLGTNQILWALSIVLFILASILAIDTVKKYFILSISLFIGNLLSSFIPNDNIDLDTDYSRIFITESQYKNRDARFMAINGYVNSGMYIDNSTELIYEYAQFYDIVDYYLPNSKNAIMFGAGAYSYPKHFQKKFPKKQLDIVEIDPTLTEIAKKYFQFTQNSSTNIIHQDARYFLSNTNKKYDAVLYDVLTSNLIAPFHLTTLETFNSISNIMTDDGVFIMNILGDLNGIGSAFLQSEIKTVKEVFPQVYVFNALGKDFEGISNHMIVGLKKKNIVEIPDTGYFFDTYFKYLISPVNIDNGIIFTDNYAPANYLISK
ncbi:MAG: fused MFS/spermidine synthase [Flavobacteriaceae bacterium]